MHDVGIRMCGECDVIIVGGINGIDGDNGNRLLQINSNVTVPTNE